jgi:KaiC/GvpD/RAD55 family RecA-like ATPase
MEKGIQPKTFMEMCRANATILINLVKQLGITTIGIAQKVEGMPGETVDNVSEFKGDGLIVMNSAAVGKTLNRTLQIKKLRKTRIDGIPHNFEFTEGGISLTS